MSPVVAAILPTERNARRDAGSVESITRRPPVIASDIGRNGIGRGAGVRRTVCDSSVMNWSASRSAGRVSVDDRAGSVGAGVPAAMRRATTGAIEPSGASVEVVWSLEVVWVVDARPLFDVVPSEGVEPSIDARRSRDAGNCVAWFSAVRRSTCWSAPAPAGSTDDRRAVSVVRRGVVVASWATGDVVDDIVPVRAVVTVTGGVVGATASRPVHGSAEVRIDGATLDR